MTSDELRALVIESLRSVAPEADPASLAGTASLRDELDLDSMDFLAFATALHDALSVDIPERDYASIDSLDGAVSYLAGKRGA